MLGEQEVYAMISPQMYSCHNYTYRHSLHQSAGLPAIAEAALQLWGYDIGSVAGTTLVMVKEMVLLYLVSVHPLHIQVLLVLVVGASFQHIQHDDVTSNGRLQTNSKFQCLYLMTKCILYSFISHMVNRGNTAQLNS